MCIIAHGLKRDFKDGEIAQCMKTNSSGNFLAIVTGSGTDRHVSVLRCLESQPVLDAVAAAPDDAEILLHARIPSRGAQSIENVHGWESEEGMRFCHNGTMHSLPKDGERTDSESFFRRLFLPMWRQEGGFTENVEYLIKVFTENGNKFAFLTPEGEVKLYGDFVEDHGCKFSNRSYIVYKYTPVATPPATRRIEDERDLFPAARDNGWGAGCGNTFASSWYDPRPSSYFDNEEFPEVGPVDEPSDTDPIKDWLSSDPARFVAFYIKMLALANLSADYSPMIHRQSYKRTDPIFDDDYAVDSPDMPWTEHLEDLENDLSGVTSRARRDHLIDIFLDLVSETLQDSIETVLPYALRDNDVALKNLLDETCKGIDAHALIMGLVLPAGVPKRNPAVMLRLVPGRFGRMRTKEVTLADIVGRQTFKRLALLEEVAGYLERAKKGETDGDLPLLSAKD